ncbi:MAG: hypothetical protein F4Z29_08785 [Gemmatimonadetes bacterium]|nr:hypothetical protein [Gemmatimonadota bacterium]
MDGRPALDAHGGTGPAARPGGRGDRVRPGSGRPGAIRGPGVGPDRGRDGQGPAGARRRRLQGMGRFGTAADFSGS